MSTILGHRLFAPPALKRYFETLSSEIYLHCKHLYLAEGIEDGTALFMKLRRRFLLTPVQLGPIMEITIGAHRRLAKTRNGYEDLGFTAHARLPYSGSKIFLRSPLGSGLSTTWRGKITKHSLHLGRMLPSLDLTEFHHDALAEVARMNAALDVFRPQAFAFDDWVVEEIERTIQSF